MLDYVNPAVGIYDIMRSMHASDFAKYIHSGVARGF